MPAALRPLLAIHLAPASLMTVAAGMLDLPGLSLAFLALASLILALLLAAAGWILRAGFSPGWGAFTFPLAAYANALAENVAPLVAGLMAGYDAFVAKLSAAGFVIRPDTSVPLMRRSFIDDPFGNRLELVDGEVTDIYVIDGNQFFVNCPFDNGGAKWPDKHVGKQRKN